MTLRIPRRFLPIFEQARAEARRQREQTTDHRTQVVAAIKAQQAERDRLRKIQRTMRIARERTAQRKAAAVRPEGRRAE